VVDNKHREIAMRCILLATIFGVGFCTAALAQLQTTVNPALPSLPQTEDSPKDPDATYCRPPQFQPDSRLMGPRVCMTNRKWDELHSQGLEITADGRNTVSCRISSTPAATQQFIVCNKGPLPKN
jgi:hypothetical protein